MSGDPRPSPRPGGPRHPAPAPQAPIADAPALDAPAPQAPPAHAPAAHPPTPGGSGTPRRLPAPSASAAPRRPARRAPEPGSIRHSATWLGSFAAAAVLLVGLLDGPAAAATTAVLAAVGGLALGRHVMAAGSQDSGYRKSVRLLGSRTLVVGEWQLIVRRTLGEDAEIHFGTAMRPQLQRLFAARLAEVHGVELFRDPARAAALVGPGLWPWLDPAAAPPRPVLDEPTLRALLDRLETLSAVRRPMYFDPPHPDPAQ